MQTFLVMPVTLCRCLNNTLPNIMTFLCPIPSLHLCMTVFTNWVRLVIAVCLVTSERHWRGLPHSFLLALSGSLTMTTILISSAIQGLFVGDWQSGSAQVTCVHQDYFAVPPLWGGRPASRHTEIRVGCCSQLERWIAKLLFLPRGHTMADASKSTRERTLRGRFRSVQLFNLLCNYTCTIWVLLCLTLVCLVNDGCTQLVSVSACFCDMVGNSPCVLWQIVGDFLFVLGPGPFSFVALLLLPLAKRKSGWGICGSSAVFAPFSCFGDCWFANVQYSWNHCVSCRVFN